MAADHDQAYTEALQYIQELTAFGINLGLGRMEALLERLDHPERGLRVIHVAGTNGKGSVVAMLGSVLRAAGWRVGAYISPHLQDYRERITINGEMIAKAEVAAGVERLRPLLAQLTAAGVEHPTEFEVSTALAFDYFARQRPDWVLLEVGLGGAIDSTNVVIPAVSVITSISFDHPDYLGNTLAQIAAVKAGIIKKGVPVVTAPQPPEVMAVLRQRAEELSAPLTEAGPLPENLELGLRGAHQRVNAAVALTVIEVLRQRGLLAAADQVVREGLASVRWPGRQELFSRGSARLLLDGAHNEAGMRALAESLAAYADGVYRRERLILCIGVLADKEIAKMAALIVPLAARVVIVKPDSPRAAWQEMADAVAALGGADNPLLIEDPVAGVQACLALAGPADLVCVTGSLYMIGAVREWLVGAGDWKSE
jgi:dihydrofolate synthase/folylpolyglutamate synthase